MININNLSKEQIQMAIELSKVQETDTITNEQAKIAHTLYNSLHKKPNLNRINDYQKTVHYNNSYERDCFDFFKLTDRIVYLSRWCLNILPFNCLFSEVGKLPLTRKDESFIEYLEGIFGKYYSMLVFIQNNIPLEYKELLSDQTLINTEKLCNKIIDSIQEYYNGFPAQAFTDLNIGFVNNLSLPGYLENTMKLTGSMKNKFYKMRIGTEYTFSKNEMFHIPLECRGLVSTNRYSIPGLPCVYLGHTPLACWEELNKPDLNTIQTSLFVSQNINYLDLSITPAELMKDLINKFYSFDLTNMKRIYSSLRDYIVLWPLIAACSVRVKNKRDSFKPEYIIPQLLLQIIRKSSFDGISYFSTKIDSYTDETGALYKNFAFPVQTQEKKGLCPILKGKFEVTNAVPWQLFQMYKDEKLSALSPFSTQGKLEFIEGMPIAYTSTDFCKLEKFLMNYWLKQDGKIKILSPNITF
ncbi:hypothetical protein CN906_20705 [Bacillus toyonensis]|nr:hypothetical protein CN906_20705 [Bacillus toyonensis]PGB31891.1 hypothetical protein COM16_17175 [Bacillus toyonensis]PHG54330.1 hypothetical protein COI57_01625 [Bacillus toyonensis]